MIKLHDGTLFPSFGLGTWKSKPGEVYDAVRHALKVGYNHLDCAAIYGNENEVGEAIRDSIAAGESKREDIWVTSKLWNDMHLKEDVRPAIEKTLNDLKLDYLDLYLIHWPVAFKKGQVFPDTGEGYLSLSEAPLEATWEGMLAVKEAGLTKQVGVSNMGPKRIDALSVVGEVPAVNQIEAHPHLAQNDLLAYCNDKGIAFTAYSPLGSTDRAEAMKKADEPPLLTHPVIEAVASRHDATPGQVLIAWAIARGTSVIPKSVNKGRIEQNLAATELELTADDMGEIAALDKGYRIVDARFFEKPDNDYTAEGVFI